MKKPVAFDLHLRLEDEVLLPDGGQAVSRAMARQSARLANDVSR